eukprot:6058796-Pyramimonas_sp.AAC.1
MAAEVIEGTVEFILGCRQQVSPDTASIVAGFDGNVTLPVKLSDLAGPLVLLPLRSHSSSMQNTICSWMAALGIRAMNTFGEAPSTNFRERLWTCGVKRALDARSQIDFIG